MLGHLLKTKKRVVTHTSAKAFIRTNLKEWGLAEKMGNDPMKCGIPCLHEKERIPIISCIGTSRDGKSTFLNILHKVAIGPGENSVPPFTSMNGHAMVTNGIDYVHIPNACMLIDCQGMALKDAKYDHFLTLIVYLISDIIILNVRQQLDLQVLNNLLAVFSFLSEIPEEHRRKDKPTLVIRIKDFQDIEAYEQNPKYLIEYMDVWLTKSGDQYDHIKEAFKLAFTIEIVVTEYPRFSDQKKKTLNVNHPSFESDNPSFIDACQKILSYEIAEQSSVLIRDPKKLSQLVNDLNANENIDYRKLDLYHNITSLELERYVHKFINIKPYNEDNLFDRMDGSKKAYDLYTDREEKISELYYNVFNVKFKDVAPDLKREIFGEWFAKFGKIINDAKEKNMKLARDKIKPHIDAYNNKYDIGPEHFLGKLTHSIMTILDDAFEILKTHLDCIDTNVRLEIHNMFNKEKKEITKIQKSIIDLNSNQINILEKNIATLNPNNTIYGYLKAEIHAQIQNCEYNCTMENTIASVTMKLRCDIQLIFENYKKTYYLDKNKIVTSTNDMKYDIEKHVPIIDKFRYWSYKESALENHVFMTNINNRNEMDMISWNANHGITLFDIKLFDEVMQMTYSTYVKLWKLPSMLKCKYKFLKIDENNYKDQKYKLVKIESDDIPTKLKIIVKNYFYELLMDYVCEHQHVDDKLIFHE